MDYFSEKKAVITGAGDGIGRQLAIQLNRVGCALWLCDINEEKLAETVKLLSNAHASCQTARVDMGSKASVYEWANSIAQQTDSLDLIVNNAGVAYMSTFEDSTDEDFEWLMNINFWGVVWSSRAFLPLLKRAQTGHLVNISSIFGMVGVPTQSAYNAAKFAVRGFTEALLAEHLTGNLKVSCVHPGGISTNIARAARSSGEETAAERDASFQALTRTTPAQAASIILKGAAAGRRRILVGPDARLTSWLVKFFPTSYHRFLPNILD
jgi:short-subunit dehydrogenase